MLEKRPYTTVKTIVIKSNGNMWMAYADWLHQKKNVELSYNFRVLDVDRTLYDAGKCNWIKVTYEE